jgi:two-component system response regulator PhoP
MKLLVLEDDAPIRDSLEEALREAGYNVESTGSAREAEGLAASFEFDALVCDISLPEGDRAGIDLVRHLRESGLRTPVVYLTGRDALEDVVAGLDAGGDDYVLKPFRLPELLARVRAQVRRARPSPESELNFRSLSINWTTNTVRMDGVEVHLTAKEYGLLEVLASHPGRVFHRDEILERVWDAAYAPDSNVVEAYIKLVRRKLGDWVIENVRSRGYRFPAE